MPLVIDLFLAKTRADGLHHEVHKLNRQSFVSIQFYLGTIEERYSNIHSPAQYALYQKKTPFRSKCPERSDCHHNENQT